VESNATTRQHEWIGVAALLYLLFVVYGSLIPFTFIDRPFDQVLAAFLPPPWISLGTTDRADWIANALLYMPLAFLALEATCAGERAARKGIRAIVVLGSLFALAIAVEFAQGFFPPRTVSLNDLAAEGAGILIGAVAWLVAGGWFRATLAGLPGNRGVAVKALALTVVLGYVVLAVFPFDFVVSIDELEARLRGPATGLVFASATCSRIMACVGRIGIEVAAGAAFGIAWHWLRGRATARTTGSVLWQALAWGAGIEVVQVVLVSGVAQGASVLARTIGIALGLFVGRLAPRMVDWVREWPQLRAAVRFAWVPYLALLVAVTGLSGATFVSMQQAWTRLADVQMMPFYYHYYVSEQWALISAAMHAALYAPVGVLAGLARLAPPAGVPRTGRAAVLVAGGLALLVETGKLFAGRRPDPTDLLLAMAGSYVAFRLVTHFIVDRGAPPPAATAGRLVVPASGPHVAFGPLTVVGAILLLGLTLALLRYPLTSTWLTAALALYGIALLRWPNAWLLVLPAVLPVLDLAPWTGWLFLDEFDLFAMLTIAAVSLVPPRAAPSRLPAGLKALVAVALVLALLALVRGLLPLEAITADVLWGLQHSTNALRPARAVLWALLLLALVRRWSDGPECDLLQFARGMTIGLIGAGLIVAWERTTFAGFANFDWSYRAVGAFSAASTAGAQLESFIAAAMPFSAVLVARRSGFGWRMAGMVAMALGAYAVAATVSRAAVLGVLVSVAVFAALNFAGRRPGPAAPRSGGLFAAAMLLAGVALAAAAAIVVSGRLASLGGDLEARREHWKLAVEMSGTDATDALLGLGFGAFPERYFWNGPAERRPALYSFRHDKTHVYVRVAPGTGTFLDQIVEAPAGTGYRVRARIRSVAPGAEVTFALCEKWILYSRLCGRGTLRTSRANEWELQEAALMWPGDMAGSRLFRPTVKFSISGGSVKTLVDITDLALVDGSGRNLLANGTFEQRGTRWFLTADDHWSWNIFNIFVEVLFEQGWLGLFAFVTWLAYALTQLTARACRGDILAAASAAALLGLLVPACFDSVIDDPRMRLLLWLLLTVPLLLPARAARAGNGR